MQTIPTDSKRALAHVKDLRTRRWSDRFTRAIITELAVYSVASNVIISVQLVSEFTPTGGVVGSAYVRPFPTERYIGTDQIFLILAEVFVAATSVWSIVQLVVGIHAKGWRAALHTKTAVLQLVLALGVLVLLGLTWLQVFIRRTTLSKFVSLKTSTLKSFSVWLFSTQPQTRWVRSPSCWQRLNSLQSCTTTAASRS